MRHIRDGAKRNSRNVVPVHGGDAVAIHVNHQLGAKDGHSPVKLIQPDVRHSERVGRGFSDLHTAARAWRIIAGNRGALRLIQPNQATMLSEEGESPSLRRDRAIGHGKHVAPGDSDERIISGFRGHLRFDRALASSSQLVERFLGGRIRRHSRGCLGRRGIRLARGRGVD